MSKLIFSTLPILALLLSGTNCAIVRPPDGKGGGSQDCKVELVLNPGDECSGSNYSLHNNDGWLVAGRFLH